MSGDTRMTDIYLHMQHLGITLYDQRKYGEAETMFNQTVQGRERILGKEHKDTLYSKHWLATTLYVQQRHEEAVEMFYQVVQDRERTLGKDHEDTLVSRHGLARTLFVQQKYKEAEEMFIQITQDRERILGKDHGDTLISRHALARTLYFQQRYEEAEKLFSQTVQSRERTVGKDHEDTLQSKYLLGLTLYHQQRYEEAEKLFSQIVQGRERTLGEDHRDTLQSKNWLALILYAQKKYEEAEKIAEQAVQVRERTIGDHPDTLQSKRLLQKIRDGRPTTGTLADRLGTFFQGLKESRPPYNDSEIYEVSALLRQTKPTWSQVPRTYIVLRTIDCLHLLDKFIDLGFSDYFFPFTQDAIPECLSPTERSRFLDAQDLVLTKSIDLEKGVEGRHQHFKKGEPLPFESKGTLGSGGFGQVDKVLSSISNREYARKRVPRKKALGGRGIEALKGMIAEIEILKRLKHHHIVDFVGSYTDPKYFSVIMSPVAEQDLSEFLKNAGSAQHDEIRTFFGCLATGLQFLHDNKIRHKDIKPSNILVDRGNILFTDFGLALDFGDASASTTVGTVDYMTHRYCAPEVALQEPRNTSSDIWCLGVVFLEMIVVLKGKTIKWMDDFLRTHGSERLFVRLNFAGLEELLAELKQTGNLSDNEILIWTQQMLQETNASRPTAASLVTSTTRPYDHGGSDIFFCGKCCRVPDDTGSDTSDDLEKDEVLTVLGLRLR